MECFEPELHDHVVAVERDVLDEELARLDVDLPAVTIEGELYRRVGAQCAVRIPVNLIDQSGAN